MPTQKNHPTKGKGYDLMLLRRFAAYTVKHKKGLFLSLALLPLISLLSLIQPYLIKEAIDNNMTPRVMEGFYAVVFLFFLALAGEVFFRMIHFYIVQSLGQKVIYNIRKDLFSHVQKLPLSFFEKTPVGKVLNRLTNDVESLNEMVSAGIVAIAGDLLTIAGISFAMLMLSPKLAAYTLLIIPLLVLGTSRIQKGMRAAYEVIRKRLSDMSAFAQETIGGIRVVQLFTCEEKNNRKFDEINKSYYEATLKSNFYDALLYSFVEASGSFIVAFLLWYGGAKDLSGGITFGILVAFIEYVNKIFVPIKDISAKFAIIQSAMTSMERIFSLMDTPPAEANQTPTGSISDEKTTISFNNVTFSYGREEVLKNISFTVKPGEKVALVGATGAGKSTIIKLLSRMYEVEKGSIEIGGKNIADISASELRKRVGVVHQDFFIFSGSVYDNIGLGRPDIDEETVKQAAKRVMAAPFIEKLPGAYHAEIKEKGSNLSSGQRQLLSLARIMAYEPSIIVMDEATSSIDVETEQHVQAGMNELFKGRTAIIIAHRLSTIKDVDKIIVLHRGEIRESGTHKELLKLKGLYYKLYELQYRDQEALNAA